MGRRPASAPAIRAAREEPGRRGPTIAQLQAQAFGKAKQERAAMIRVTTSGLAQAEGLSASVRNTLTGEVPRMLGLRDFIVEANQKAGVSPEQAAQRLQARLEKRVEHLVQREASCGHRRQRPHSAAPLGRPARASQRSKPSWNPTATSASTYDGLGHAAATSAPFARGGGGRIGRANTSRRIGSRSLQLVPMEQQQEDEMERWEQTIQRQASNPAAGHSVFGAWSEECTDDTAAWRNSSTAISTPDSPPASPSLSRGGPRRPDHAVCGPRDINEMDAAVRELAEAVRPEWGNIVLALRRAADATAGGAGLSARDIVRVLQSIPAVSEVCDAALINAVVHHVEAQLREGAARQSAPQHAMGYIGLLQRLKTALQPSNLLEKEQPLLAEPAKTEEKSSLVSPAPWQTQKVEVRAAPKPQTQSFDQNTEMMVHAGVAQPYEKRVVHNRVLESLKGGSLRHAFRDMDTDGNGTLSKRELREALWKLDIDMNDDAFDDMVAAIDTDASGEIDFAEFKHYFMKKGLDNDRRGVTPSGLNAHAASAPMGVIVSMPLNQCVAMIQDKVRARLRGGPAELRRTFQFFDTNRSGKIDRDDFIAGLKHRCGLVFAPALMGRIWLHFTEGGGGLSAIDYKTFCRTVCCSTQDDDTTFNAASRSLSRTTANDMGNTSQFIRRRIREHLKDLRRELNFAAMHDPIGDGCITAEALRSVLYKYNIIFQDDTFASVVLELNDPNKQAGSGRISHEQFLLQFGNGTPEDQLTSGVVRLSTTSLNSDGNGKYGNESAVGASTANIASGAEPAVSPADIRQAHRMIQDVLRGRLRSGPAELRRAFKLFDRSADGKIDREEWYFALHRHLGLAFEQPLCDALFTKFARSGGQAAEDGQPEMTQQESCQQSTQKHIDYHSFCHQLMESKPGGNSGTGLLLQTRASCSSEAV